MLEWFLLGVLLGIAVISIAYTVVYLTRYIMEQKLREAKKRVKEENPNLNEAFAYIIKERGDNIATVSLLHNNEEIAEVNFTSERKISSDLYAGMRNYV